MKNNTLLTELLILGIESKLDRITERLGSAVIDPESFSADRKAKALALYGQLIDARTLYQTGVSIFGAHTRSLLSIVEDIQTPV